MNRRLAEKTGAEETHEAREARAPRDTGARDRIEELDRANRDLIELARLKNQFISNVAHELRTPLTSIHGYTELLAEAPAERLGPAERQMVGVIAQNGRRLLTLIEDLLNLSLLEHGRMPLDPAPTDLPALIERCRTTMRPAVAAHPGLTLVIGVEPGVGTIPADAAQLERVLLNLLANAVKFSPDGGTITVRAGHSGQWLVLSVSDTGIGITAAELPRLFGRFFRSEDARHRRIPGTGLGLAITRSVVEAHGGTIAVESSVGIGSTFTVRLPRTGP